MKNNIPLEGFMAAARITRKYAKTFYFASRFLTKDKRAASYAVYAVCRLSDESVDNNSAGSKSRLEKIQSDINTAYSQKELKNPILCAFRETVQKHAIPKAYFDTLIDGMYMDLSKTRYADFNELYGYCYNVAGIVGLIMLKIFGYENSLAEKYAVDLGIAMQLTNILRDIKEDSSRGRIYLPQDEMQKHGVSEKNIFEEKIDEKFKSFLKAQIQRARGYYKGASSGISMIKEKHSRFVVRAMLKMYSGILDEIENSGYDVFSRRAHVNTLKKCLLVLGLALKR